MLDLLRDGDDEFSPENSDGIAMEENPTAHINVVLSSDATMASEFHVKVNDCSTTFLLDTGTSHSCMSYECFKNVFPKGQLQEIRCIKVENASGKSMEPKGLYVKQLLHWDLRTSYIPSLYARNLQVQLYWVLIFQVDFSLVQTGPMIEECTCIKVNNN